MDGVNDGNDGRKCGYGQERGPCSRVQEPRTSQTGDGERPMPFSERELDATGRILREHCREQGMCDAIRMYLREPLDHWMETLRCGGDLGRADMAALAVGMSRTLAIRDALLISIIIDEERCPREFLLDFASRPMLPRNARRLEECCSAHRSMMPPRIPIWRVVAVALACCSISSRWCRSPTMCSRWR